MELKEIRRLNALYQEKKSGSRIALALALGYKDTNYLNGLFSGANPFGNKVAKKFETKLDLGDRWMSTPHPALWVELNEDDRGGKDFSDFLDSMFDGFDKSQYELAIAVAAKRLRGEEL